MSTNSPAPRRALPLSREAVVEAALNVTAARGIEGLTMRAIGRELGVSAMALYKHVQNKDELIDLVASAVVARWEPLRLGSLGWEESLRRHLLSQWREQARYPGLSGVLVERSFSDVMAHGITAGVRFFEQAGFDEVEARLAATFAMTYINGRLSVEAHLRGSRAQGHRNAALTSENYVIYSVTAVIAGIRALRESSSSTLPGTKRREASKV